MVRLKRRVLLRSTQVEDAMARMKILIGFDGSEHSRGALLDTRRACLPADAQCIVLTASEVWTAYSPQLKHLEEVHISPGQTAPVAAPTHRGIQALHEAQATADAGAELLRGWFPNWDVTTEARSDSAMWALIDRANEWQPDLLIVGTHGRTALNRVLIGSVSQKVLTDATCSIRVARAPWTTQPAAVRTIIAVDGSRDSLAAIEEAQRRVWPAGSAIHLLHAFDLSLVGSGNSLRFVDPVELIAASSDTLESVNAQIDAALTMLAATGAVVTSEVRVGKPVETVLEVAHGWGADSIMLSARGHGFFERLVLGSVAVSLARKAGCSIEVVRPWRHAQLQNGIDAPES